MADTYIIVRVNEKHPGGIRTDAASIRRAIHDTVTHYGLDAGDIMLSEHPNGVQAEVAGSYDNAKQDWTTVDIMFASSMARVRRLVAERKADGR